MLANVLGLTFNVSSFLSSPFHVPGALEFSVFTCFNSLLRRSLTSGDLPTNVSGIIPGPHILSYIPHWPFERNNSRESVFRSVSLRGTVMIHY